MGRNSCSLRYLVVLYALGCSAAAGQSPLASKAMAADVALTADPRAAHWRDVKGVVTATDRFGKPVPNGRTEIRSRWTDKNLYFLFVSNFDSTHLRPEHTPGKETWGLWDYDVVEVFIGWDLKNIHLYKEFEVSPRDEWVDLDVDKNNKAKMVDWLWNSNFRFKSHVDQGRKVWVCEMQIPWSSIETRPVKAGNELRLNLYRIEGAPPNRKFIAWQPVMNESYHTPERFGRLRLVP
jgi:hypothetical protein